MFAIDRKRAVELLLYVRRETPSEGRDEAEQKLTNALGDGGDVKLTPDAKRVVLSAIGMWSRIGSVEELDVVRELELELRGDLGEHPLKNA